MPGLLAPGGARSSRDYPDLSASRRPSLVLGAGCIKSIVPIQERRGLLAESEESGFKSQETGKDRDELNARDRIQADSPTPLRLLAPTTFDSFHGADLLDSTDYATDTNITASAPSARLRPRFLGGKSMNRLFFALALLAAAAAGGCRACSPQSGCGCGDACYGETSCGCGDACYGDPSCGCGCGDPCSAPCNCGECGCCDECRANVCDNGGGYCPPVCPQGGCNAFQRYCPNCACGDCCQAACGEGGCCGGWSGDYDCSPYACCGTGCGACGGCGCPCCAPGPGCCCASGDQNYNFAPGPPTGQTAYPYYTVRGPRDFLQSNPQPLGPY